MAKIVIIGAGFGGLAASALLAQDGHDVLVIEKNSMPGGRAMRKDIKGYYFDMGPSWYLMPEVFEKLYTQLGKNISEELQLKKLDPAYKIFTEGTSFDVPGSKDKLEELFESFETGARKKIRRYLNEAQKRYSIAMNDFIYKKYTSIKDVLDWRLATQGIKLNLFGNLHNYVKKQFKDTRLQKILEYSMVFLGGSPKNTPALYSIMSHVDLQAGVWYPKGGMHAVAQNLHQIAKEQGATFLFDTEIQKILTTEKKVSGVQLKDKEISADIVIANADYHHVETKLLEKNERSYSDAYWNSRVVAPSAFILYLGIAKKLPMLQHHNLVLEGEWEEHFTQIFDKPKWPDRPSYYICNPSTSQKDVAPKGKENVFVLVPVAPGLEDTPQIREQYKEFILNHMETTLNTKIKEYVEVCEIFAHKDFESMYNSFKGTALGLSHTLKQTALLRPAHKSKHIKNLYYTGQYTHPGVGVPMALISSQIVYGILHEQEKNIQRRK